ncbi:hypothetical protein AB0E83_15785 [Streptomyces sp. NPDC035033]|uniref:hypothetical protein n=1 Tax=Streptomyces sp. NPDC035033 TaxID=3155368 RepID=UPI0033EF1DC9
MTALALEEPAERFAPGTGLSGEALPAWVTGDGAAVSPVANPLFGALLVRRIEGWPERPRPCGAARGR